MSMIDAVERDQGRTGQGRGSFMKDMGCMLSRAGDGDAGEGVAEVRNTYRLLVLGKKKNSEKRQGKTGL